MPSTTNTSNSPTWLGQPIQSAKQLEDAGYSVPEHLLISLYHDEQKMVEALERIQRDATALLAEVRGGNVLQVAREVRDDAGCSGPIGSQWEKAVMAATALNVLSFTLMGFVPRTEVPEVLTITTEVAHVEWEAAE